VLSLTINNATKTEFGFTDNVSLEPQLQVQATNWGSGSVVFRSRISHADSLPGVAATYNSNTQAIGVYSCVSNLYSFEVIGGSITGLKIFIGNKSIS
jgi:hypothetical protein